MYICMYNRKYPNGKKWRFRVLQRLKYRALKKCPNCVIYQLSHKKVTAFKKPFPLLCKSKE